MVYCFLVHQEFSPKLDLRASLQSFAEACYYYTPRIVIRENEAVFLDVSRTLQLFQGQSLIKRWQILAERFGLKGAWYQGQNATQVWLRALWKKSKKGFFLEQNWLKECTQEFPIEACLSLEDPFGLQNDLNKNGEIKKKKDEVIRILKKLGKKKAKDFLKISADSIGIRLGDTALRIQKSISTSFGYSNDNEVWPEFFLNEPLVEKFSVFNSENFRGVSGIESLIFLLKPMLDRLVSRLRSRSEKIAELQLQVTQEWSLLSEKIRNINLKLSTPLSSVSTLLSILKNKLEKEFLEKPIESEIIEMEIYIIEVAPGFIAQRDFFKKEIEEKEKIESFFLRVESKIGEGNIFFARTLEDESPERAWSKVKFKEKGSKNADSQRLWPSRLLSCPLRLIQRGNILNIDDRDFRNYESIEKKSSWIGVSWIGPERICNRWWSHSVERDYYRVETQGGELLWVFIESSESVVSLFLHGFFD